MIHFVFNTTIMSLEVLRLFVPSSLLLSLLFVLFIFLRRQPESVLFAALNHMY
jgi:hypothetical protein